MIARLLKSLTALFGAQVISRLGSFLLVPAYLMYWSPVVYGEWLTLFSLAGYLGTLDFGMHLASINRLTKSYARGELDDYRRYQHSTWAFCIGVFVIGTCILTVLIWLLPIPAWLNLTVTSPQAAKTIILILGAYVLGCLPLKFLCSIYQTTGNLARSQWVNNIQQFATICLMLTILLAGGRMLAIALVLMGVLVLTTAYVMFDVKRRFPALLPGISLARVDIIKEQMKPSSLFALLTGANALMYQGTIILVSSFLGGIAVAVFSISRTLSLLIRQLVDTLSIALWPELTLNEGRGELGKLRSLHRLLVGSCTSLCLASGAFLFFEGETILRVWTANRIEPDILLLRLLLLWMVLEAPWLASSAISASSNRHKTFAWCFFLSVMIGLGGIAVLVPRFGLWSVPLGFLFGEAAVCYHFVIRNSCRIIEQNYSRFAWRLWLGLLANGVLVLLIAWAVSLTFREYTPLRLVLIGISTLTISALGGWYMWLESSDRTLVIERLRPLIGFLSPKAVAASRTYDV